jgi:hypothetical protein
MNLLELQRKLIAAARTDHPSDRMPLAFEKRIVALIKGRPLIDQRAVWSRALWCAAAPCVAVMLTLSAWAFFQPPRDNISTDLAQQFHQTMLAALDQDTDISW